LFESLEELVEDVLEELLDAVRLSTWARYFFASLVSPDLIDENRPVSAVSRELWLLEELEVEEADSVDSSEKRELVLCRLETSRDGPSGVEFSMADCLSAVEPQVIAMDYMFPAK